MCCVVQFSFVLFAQLNNKVLSSMWYSINGSKVCCRTRHNLNNVGTLVVSYWCWYGSMWIAHKDDLLHWQMNTSFTVEDVIFRRNENFVDYRKSIQQQEFDTISAIFSILPIGHIHLSYPNGTLNLTEKGYHGTSSNVSGAPLISQINKHREITDLEPREQNEAIDDATPTLNCQLTPFK